jgi:DNA ligase-1
MSEKLDGVRAYWDGQAFISRLGNTYYAPEWFVAGLPNVPLDGELWGGRKNFQRAVSIVRRQDKSDLWKEISFVVFDGPSFDAPFEERIARCRALLEATRPPYARIHEHATCDGIDSLRAELGRIEALGGEGLMLRQPGSRYVAGRSTTLLKVKSFHDAEARIVDHLPGQGRHKGRLGALLVEMADGTRFSVGTGFSDAERASPPPIGEIITYRYQELSTAGVPRFPSYVAVRHDVPLPSASIPVTPTSRPEATPPSPPASPGRRRFELVEGESSKFWEIEVRDAELTVAFGRIGTVGQSKTKTLPSHAAAALEAGRLIGEKTAKGYREIL